jgi:hypothetical protein
MEFLKFLHVKKQQLNKRLYESHLYNAQIWDKSWNMIESNINEKVKKIMKKKYTTHERKLKNLRENQN